MKLNNYIPVKIKITYFKNDVLNSSGNNNNTNDSIIETGAENTNEVTFN